MSIRNLLEVKTTREIKKRVNGTIIAISAHGITVFLPLREWNINGLDAVISK